MSKMGLLKPITPDKHDWIEDFGEENGKYQRACSECKADFLGHKRRTECKACAILGWQRLAIETLKLRYWYPADMFKPKHRENVLVYYPERVINGCKYEARKDLTVYHADAVYEEDEVDTGGFWYNGCVGDCAPAYWTYVLDDPDPNPETGNISPHLIWGVDLAAPGTKDYTL